LLLAQISHKTSDTKLCLNRIQDGLQTLSYMKNLTCEGILLRISLLTLNAKSHTSTHQIPRAIFEIQRAHKLLIGLLVQLTSKGKAQNTIIETKRTDEMICSHAISKGLK